MTSSSDVLSSRPSWQATAAAAARRATTRPGRSPRRTEKPWGVAVYHFVQKPLGTNTFQTSLSLFFVYGGVSLAPRTCRSSGRPRTPPPGTRSAAPRRRWTAGASRTRKGTNGVSTNGVTANFMFFDRRPFWVPICQNLSTSVNFVLFPQSVKIHYFCSGPIIVDPIRPQPKDTRFVAQFVDGRPAMQMTSRRYSAIGAQPLYQLWVFFQRELNMSLSVRDTLPERPLSKSIN